MQISYIDNQNQKNSIAINETTLVHVSNVTKTIVDSIALNSPNDINEAIAKQ